MIRFWEVHRSDRRRHRKWSGRRLSTDGIPRGRGRGRGERVMMERVRLMGMEGSGHVGRGSAERGQERIISRGRLLPRRRITAREGRGGVGRGSGALRGEEL